ncbi:unnamed protein product [Adineta ricciae]|uniref:Uncharacterized protein n=1 Tax=Adineta ricciae TaxID=249248 RepID=A0A813ST86_ADIRI|nr:unnamed protein product [Adineta ricciae]CAF0800339.1 unnamed protein product [Adineta ricciae]
MATSSSGNRIYICHFCSAEHSSRATLYAHLLHCQTRKASEVLNNNHSELLKLHQDQCDILYMVKLHPSIPQFSLNHFDRQLSPHDLNLQIPLSSLYTQGYLSSSKQSSFDDLDCLYSNTPIYTPSNDVNDEQENSPLLDDKSLTYHVYKYSRRERNPSDVRLKHAQIRRPIQSKTKNSCSKDELPSMFSSSTNVTINIPTQIHARQRLECPSQPISPLLFCPNFHTLVKLPTNEHFGNYLLDIRVSFHLLHSIASQEFQIIVHNTDQQHDFLNSSSTLINALRDTMLSYITHLPNVFKRHHSQSFHPDEHDLTNHHDNELSIPPLKIRRHDDSSYEIEKRSTSSSSSSSGMSITQIHNGQHYDERRRFDTRPMKYSSRISDNHQNSNFNDTAKRDSLNYSVDSPLQCDLSLVDHQQSKERNNSESFLSSETKPKKSISPVSLKEHSNDSLPKYQSVALNEGARIRIVNCSNDNNKHSSSRNQSLTSTTTKYSNSNDKVDENWSTKSTRINTRKISSTNSKTPDIAQVSPTYQAQAVLLSQNEIANNWSTHGVFYRCHACSHEEFFVVYSRECMRLHISSKHGNMEENFKQRISNFLNNQGRALKIFQHYLKWQQPWSEKEIDQIFQLSNANNNRINGIDIEGFRKL